MYATCNTQRITWQIILNPYGGCMIKQLKRPETLKSQVVEWIMELMASGQLELDKVYSANHFAKAMGISRTPVREALLQLTSDGYFVSLLGRGFQLRKFSEKEITDFFETRKLIETYIIEHIEELLTEDFIQILEDNLHQMIKFAAKEDITKFLQTDKTFHMSLVNLYNNTQFVAIMENIRNLMITMGEQALGRPERLPEVISEHRLIIDALSQKDFKTAVEAMFDHITTTEQKVRHLH